jgi:Protein of unknown function (DUF2846)
MARMKNIIAVVLLAVGVLLAQDAGQDAAKAVAQDAAKDETKDAAQNVAKDQATPRHARAACGSGNVLFDVKSGKSHHPMAQPAEDKALVYVVENLRAGCFLCDTTARVGLDGAWVGAAKGNSYFFFAVEPGEHHLCADLQAVPAASETTSLASFTAEAGKTYYFRVRLTDQNNSGKGGVNWAVDLEPIDSDQAQFLIASYGVSTSRRRK